MIVGGHDHMVLAAPVEILNPAGVITWLVQAEAFYRRIGKLQLAVNEGEVSLLNYQSIALDQWIPENPATGQMVNALIADVEQIYGPVYSQGLEYCDGYFDEIADSLLYPGYKDTPLGNLVCDAFRAYTGTDIAIEPGGSTAQPIEPGVVYGFNLFRAVGYGFNTDNGLGFRLATFDISGEALWAGLEFGVSQIEQNDEFLIQVSGLNYVYNPDNNPFERVLDVQIAGAPLDPEGIYSVTTNEYVVSILNYLQIPYQNLRVLSGLSEYEVLQAYVPEIGFLYPYRYGRIIAGNRADADFWRHSSAPLNLKYQDITVTSAGHLFAAAEDSGLFRSVDGGKSWTAQNNGLTHHMAFSVAEAPNGDLFAGSWGIFRSSDNGDSWQAAGSTLMVPFCIAFKSDGDDQYIFAGTGGGIWRSADNGANWDTASYGLPRPNSIDIRDLAVSADGTIYAATGEGLYQSNDSGDSWLPADSVFKTESINMRTIAINSKGHIFAGGNRSFKSLDGGQSWSELTMPGPYSITALAINQQDGIYAASWGPVYHSGDNGDSFQHLDSDLEDIQMYALAVNEEGILFAASGHAGIFRSTNSTLVTNIRESLMIPPENFDLMQNYPNPFNPSTTIAFVIEAQGHTVLEIFDIQGRKIDTLIDRRMPPGRHMHKWDGRNHCGQAVACGIYVYRLSVNNQQFSRKMLLLR